MSASIIAPTLPAAAILPPRAIRPRSSAFPDPAPRAAAHLVELLERRAVELRDHQAAAARIDQEPLVLQQSQRLVHRLAGDIEGFSQLFLGNARARRQPSFADGREELLVDLLGELGTAVDTLERWHTYNAYCIRYSEST